MKVLVVDGANVVGARRDGWWKDRAGAAQRLHERLVTADLDGDIAMVLEGAAKAGVPVGLTGTSPSTQGRRRRDRPAGHGPPTPGTT